VHMCKNLQLVGWRALPQTPIRALPLDHTRGLPVIPPFVHVALLAALGGNECLWFSLRLWFTNDVCSSPNSWRIMNQSPVPGPSGIWRSAGYERHGFVAAWHWQKLWSWFAFTVYNPRNL